MDIGAFSEENFDVKDWINKTFKSEDAKSNEEAYMSSLVMKLQLYVQQVNSALEDTSQQVLQSLPRVLRDVELIQQEAVLLRQKMDSVKQEIVKVEQDTGQSMASLERLDKLKCDLQLAKQALHEADNWSALATVVEEAFESGDIELISLKISSMQQSLKILANVPDYEEKRLQLEGLKNRLEAIASPLLIQAFASGNTAQCAMLTRVFSTMDRLSQLQQYQHKWQRGVILKQWRTIVEEEEGTGALECTRRLHAFLLSPPRSWVLLTDVLGSLDPSITNLIDADMKRQQDPLELVLQLKQTIVHFASSLQATGKSEEDNVVKTLAEVVFSPLTTYMNRYSSWEQQHLCSQVCILVGHSGDNLMETVQELGQSVPRTAALVSEAIQRCLNISEGCALPGLLQALEVFFMDYLEKYRGTLHHLKQRSSNKEDWNMVQMCLTLLQIVGSLLNQLNALSLELKKTVIEASRKLQALDSKYFTQYPRLLLKPDDQKSWNLLVTSVREGENLPLMQSVQTEACKICRDVHHMALQVMFGPIPSHLEQVLLAQSWSVNSLDVPDFGLAPQEYITQIGQYLMTLPQHLEPFLLQDNPSFQAALQQADSNFSDGSLADVLLGEIARSTCLTYCDNILSLPELSPAGCRQLAADIDYLGNVLEDLGLKLSDPLEQVSLLLKLPPESYHTKSAGCSPRIVAGIRQLRTIM